jgi:cytoskeletal protein CcmA (bactofilin family)
MNSAAHIGPSIRIKGEIITREPLTIAGHVDGTIDADGHPLTALAGSQIKATVTAETIVVGGSLHGQLIANARIVVQQTAAIEGELSAPAISLADGASVHGRIETGERKKPALSLAS